MTQSQQMIEELYDSYTTAAANIISYYEVNDRKKKLKELREIVMNNCIQETRLKKAEDIKNRLLNLYDDDTETNIESIIKEYKQAISEIHTDALKEDKLLEYDQQVEALLHDTGEEDENDSDAELQLTGGYINIIDPISKKRIVDPVKNTICGHTYDRESIVQILKINKKTRCPVIGCKNTEFVTLANLKTDIVTKTYLKKNPV